MKLILWAVQLLLDVISSAKQDWITNRRVNHFSRISFSAENWPLFWAQRPSNMTDLMDPITHCGWQQLLLQQPIHHFRASFCMLVHSLSLGSLWKKEKHKQITQQNMKVTNICHLLISCINVIFFSCCWNKRNPKF